MALPKIIHYCWFGGALSETEQECIASWKNCFSDYEIRLWNENNVDLEQCTYARQAFEQKEYAFLSDYVRAKVLYEHGGIYLDADVKMLKPLSNTANNFVGFERKTFVGTAIIGCEKGNPVIGKLLNYYEKNPFLNEQGGPNRIANVSILTDLFKEEGLVLNGTRQQVAGFEVYEREYFYPKKNGEKEFQITERTEAIHLCTNSWMSEREKKRGTNRMWIRIVRPVLRKCRTLGIRIAGKERIKNFEIILRNRLR